MSISVFVEQRNENLTLQAKGKMIMGEVLEKVNANPVESVVALNGEIVTEDAVVKDGDEVKIFSVVSGG